MAKFTMIDINSGLVWGTASADNITDAARVLDESLGEFGLAYEVGTISDMRTTASAYAVYENATDAEYAADDYAIVAALPLAGYVTITTPAE